MRGALEVARLARRSVQGEKGLHMAAALVANYRRTDGVAAAIGNLRFLNVVVPLPSDGDRVARARRYLFERAKRDVHLSARGPN